MSDQAQNNNQSAPAADNATATETVGPLMSEFGPNGNPVNPQGEDQGDGVDTNLVLDTFFGDGQYEPNSGEGQMKGSNSSDGQSDSGLLAPSKAAPAANAGVDSPQSGSTSEQQQGQTEQVSGADQGAQTQTQGQSAQPSSEPQSAPQLSIEDRLALASANALKQQNTELLQRLRAYETGQQTQTQQTQGQGQQQTQPPQSGQGTEPALRLAVPDALYDAVFDENPATSKQALNVLITAVAQNAVNHALQSVDRLVDEKLTAVTQAIESGKKVSEMEEAYFGRFPAHKNELYRPLIQSVVDEKFKAYPAAEWNETMIDAVGATVDAKLKALGIDTSTKSGQPQQRQDGQTSQQTDGTRRQTPAPMLDGSTRAGGNKVPTDTGEFIASTFG